MGLDFYFYYGDGLLNKRVRSSFLVFELTEKKFVLWLMIFTKSALEQFPSNYYNHSSVVFFCLLS